MRVRSGTSGYSYKEWRGELYPDGLPAAEMLRSYATRLPTVELNNTFYRMPKATVVAGWAEQVPPDFRFVIKASQRITHRQRLVDVADSVAYLFKVIAILEDKLGAVLFQLPPFLKKDLPLLTDFLAVLPSECRPVLEFRHPSWFDDSVYDLLRAARAALCGGDLNSETNAPPLVATADFGYLRMRRDDASYSAQELDSWAERIAEQRWSEAFVFFKHEQQGPALARAFNARFPASREASLDEPVLARADAPGSKLGRRAVGKTVRKAERRSPSVAEAGAASAHDKASGEG